MNYWIVPWGTMGYPCPTKTVKDCRYHHGQSSWVTWTSGYAGTLVQGAWALWPRSAWVEFIAVREEELPTQQGPRYRGASQKSPLFYRETIMNIGFPRYGYCIVGDFILFCFRLCLHLPEDGYSPVNFPDHCRDGGGSQAGKVVAKRAPRSTQPIQISFLTGWSVGFHCIPNCHANAFLDRSHFSICSIDLSKRDSHICVFVLVFIRTRLEKLLSL